MGNQFFCQIFAYVLCHVLGCQVRVILALTIYQFERKTVCPIFRFTGTDRHCRDPSGKVISAGGLLTIDEGDLIIALLRGHHQQSFDGQA